jgi:hypothetical protein
LPHLDPAGRSHLAARELRDVRQRESVTAMSDSLSDGAQILAQDLADRGFGQPDREVLKREIAGN